MVRHVSPATAISLSVCMFDAGKEKRFRKREKNLLPSSDFQSSSLQICSIFFTAR